MTTTTNNNMISDIDIGKPEYWLYKGEGAMNVVLSYVGPSNNKLNGLVLRVKKLSNGGSNLEKEIELYKFVNNVMSPLLGEKYVFSGLMISITKEFLEKLDNQIHSNRPLTRSEIRLDTSLTVAFLIEDLTKLDNVAVGSGSSIGNGGNGSTGGDDSDGKNKVFCVEIKPKWGFLPMDKEYLNVETKETKLTTCRYCMHQHTKLADGSISEFSKYCPIDLFSEDLLRIEYSIIQLIHHPQNNLKVYCDGILSFTGSLGGGIERSQFENCKILSNLLISNKIITDNTTTTTTPILSPTSTIDHNISILSTIISNILQRESILQNIKKIQCYDQYDIEGIIYLYNKLNNINNINIPTSTSSQDFSNLDKLTNEESQEIINKFMVSCTAKDCSIMISFIIDNPIDSISQINIKPNFNFINIIDSNNKQPTTTTSDNNTTTTTTIKYKIGVVDLDTKKQSAIPKYFKLDQEIVKLYKSNSTIIKSCK